jgi:hypothetical protein
MDPPRQGTTSTPDAAREKVRSSHHRRNRMKILTQNTGASEQGAR